MNNMDGFYVAKFKVHRKHKAMSGGHSGDVPTGGNGDVDVGDGGAEKPAFDDEEDKGYIEGSSHH